MRMLRCDGIHLTKLEFDMYMEKCVLRDLRTSKFVIIQQPNKEGLISFLLQIRKTN